MLANIDYTQSYQGRGDSVIPGQTLVSLEYDFENDGDKLRIFVERSGSKRMVSVRHIEGRRGGEGTRYENDVDGTIVRNDLGNGYEKAQQRREMGEDLTITENDSEEEKLDKMRRLPGAIAEGAANSDLEQYMGLNRQPISFEEAQRLADLVENSEPRRL